jgi:hypothetical protein
VPPAPPQPQPQPAPRVLPMATLRLRIVRSPPSPVTPISVKKPSQPQPNLPPPPLPVPLVTIDNSDAARTNAQRLLEQATAKMGHINRAELAETAASTYQQANELINAAQRAMADRDYLAASGLAEKASALTSQLPSQK